MNAARRREIKSIIEDIENVIESINDVKDDEEFAMDGMPENLQGSDRYAAMEEAADNMDSAVGALEEAMSYLESAAN